MLIVEAKQNGELGVDIAKRFHVDPATVSRIWSRWKTTKTVKTKKKSGRPRKITPAQRRLLVRMVKKDPFVTAVEVMNYANKNLGMNIKIRTARNILINEGLRGRRPAKKPWISKKTALPDSNLPATTKTGLCRNGLVYFGRTSLRTIYLDQMEFSL